VVNFRKYSFCFNGPFHWFVLLGTQLDPAQKTGIPISYGYSGNKWRLALCTNRHKRRAIVCFRHELKRCTEKPFQLPYPNFFLTSNYLKPVDRSIVFCFIVSFVYLYAPSVLYRKYSINKLQVVLIKWVITLLSTCCLHTFLRRSIPILILAYLTHLGKSIWHDRKIKPDNLTSKLHSRGF